MNKNIPQPQQEQAADYVLNQLSDAEQSAMATKLAEDAAMRVAVKEMSDAAAAIVFTTKQVLPPSKPVRRNGADEIEKE